MVINKSMQKISAEKVTCTWFYELVILLRLSRKLLRPYCGFACLRDSDKLRGFQTGLLTAIAISVDIMPVGIFNIHTP